MSKFFISGFLIFVNFACSNKITSSKTSNKETPITEYSEDLAVFRPKYETNNSTSKPGPANSSKSKNSEQGVSNNFNDQNAEADKVLSEIIENNKKNTSGRGFRIQVFSGNSREDFENAKSFLLRNFEELEIYESYSQPTYTIKVGDFVQYSDAERYQKDLRGRFNTTRIVGDKINLKKALNIK